MRQIPKGDALKMTNAISLVSQMSNDERVQVFRCSFTPPERQDWLKVDAYVVITDRYVIICDTMLCPEDMHLLMQEIQPALIERELLIVNSHADWDHVWGNCYFSGKWNPPIIAHSLCRKRMLSEETREKLTDFQKRYITFQNVELAPPTLTFDQTLTIYGGDLTLQLFPAPGHQPDHIAAWIPELRLLLTFDAVEHPLPTLANPAGVPAMFATLEHFLALQPARVLCSHGGTTEVTQVEKNLRYLHEIEQRARSLLTTHHPTSADLISASVLREYSFAQVLSEMTTPDENADEDAFYREAHDTNVHHVVEWLISQH
jgi:glyoxylase-like metal-dependent hydrolase (beta-lactamase superfamily II)